MAASLALVRPRRAMHGPGVSYMETHIRRRTMHVTATLQLPSQVRPAWAPSLCELATVPMVRQQVKTRSTQHGQCYGSRLGLSTTRLLFSMHAAKRT